jgi:hypothetical protein
MEALLVFAIKVKERKCQRIHGRMRQEFQQSECAVFVTKGFHLRMYGRIHSANVV